MSAHHIVQELAPGPSARWRKLHLALHAARQVRSRAAHLIARLNWGLILATGACAYAWGVGLMLLINAVARARGL